MTSSQISREKAKEPLQMYLRRTSGEPLPAHGNVVCFKCKGGKAGLNYKYLGELAIAGVIADDVEASNCEPCRTRNGGTRMRGKAGDETVTSFTPQHPHSSIRFQRTRGTASVVLVWTALLLPHLLGTRPVKHILNETNKLLRLCLNCKEYHRAVFRSVDVPFLDVASELDVTAGRMMACSPKSTDGKKKGWQKMAVDVYLFSSASHLFTHSHYAAA